MRPAAAPSERFQKREQSIARLEAAERRAHRQDVCPRLLSNAASARQPGSTILFGRAHSSKGYLYNPSMHHHTVAAVSIAGTGLDLLGSLYLAYDLLGGQHGPLRLLTRTVTYSIVFGIGYALASVFSLVSPPALLPASPLRSNSIEQLAGWITIRCLGKDCSPPSAGLLSALDCTGLWASDSQWRLPFSSQSDRYSPILAACVLLSIM